MLVSDQDPARAGQGPVHEFPAEEVEHAQGHALLDRRQFGDCQPVIGHTGFLWVARLPSGRSTL
jgi:hypothetical protein